MSNDTMIPIVITIEDEEEVTMLKHIKRKSEVNSTCEKRYKASSLPVSGHTELRTVANVNNDLVEVNCRETGRKKIEIGLMKQDKREIVFLPVNDDTERRNTLIERIEEITLAMTRDICNKMPPMLSYTREIHEIYDPTDSQTKEDDFTDESLESFDINAQDFGSEETESDDPDSGIQESLESQEILKTKRTRIEFSKKAGRAHLPLLIKIMAYAHQNLIKNTTLVKRALYYELHSQFPTMVTSSTQIEYAVRQVSYILKCAPWDLGFISSSCGLIAGDIIFKLKSGVTLKCSSSEGTIIPQFMTDKIKVMKSSAKLIIVIEKDAVFSRLLSLECTRFFKCILITGKGMPDVATRMLVRLISEKFRIPVFALVDPNPFGIEIMCTYRFGSANLFEQNDQLVCPVMKWIGIHPSELENLEVKTVPLTAIDLRKLKSLESRTYVKENEKLLDELRILKRIGKADIEGIDLIYLMNVYLDDKMRNELYI